MGWIGIACCNDHHEVESILIGTAGVDLNLADNDGYSPLRYAVC